MKVDDRLAAVKYKASAAARHLNHAAGFLERAGQSGKLTADGGLQMALPTFCQTRQNPTVEKKYYRAMLPRCRV
jgi:hypothetical protein